MQTFCNVIEKNHVYKAMRFNHQTVTKNVETLRREQNPNALNIERILFVALTQLYGTEKNPIDFYRSNRYEASDYIRSATLSAEKPKHGHWKPKATELQTALSNLVPYAERMNLYFSIYRYNEPTHCVSLVRKDGLWNLAHPRIRVLRGTAPRSGAILYWKDIAPPDYIAIGLTPKLHRISYGHHEDMALFIENDPRARHQLTNCAAVLKLTQALHGNRLTVWQRQGKSVFEIANETSPYTFARLLTNPTVLAGHKKRALIFAADPNDLLIDTLGNMPFYFLPSIKDRTAVTKIAGSVGVADEITRILLCGVVPILGYPTDKGTDVYTLHYEPRTGFIGPALLYTTKTYQLPILYWDKEQNQYIPNFVFLEALKTFFLSGTGWEQPVRNVLSLTQEDWVELFTDICESSGLILTGEEIAALINLKSS